MSWDEANVSNMDINLSFIVALTWQEYEELNQHCKSYKRNDYHDYQSKCYIESSSHRNYNVFQQNYWTHCLSKKIEGVLRRQGNACSIIFKRNKIFVRLDSKYAEIIGTCKGCSAKLHGVIENQPRPGEVIITSSLKNVGQHTKQI